MENLSVLPIGTIIQGTHYRIDEVLGQGSFGITYKVTDTILERVYALKEFFPQDTAERNSVSLMLNALPNKEEQFKTLQKKFISEAKALADCNHPGIVKIHNILTHGDNTIYYRMDFIEGVTLNERCKGQPIQLQEAAAMILKIAEPLKYIHEKKIAHLDLNPNNVMLRSDDSVVLIDFGFAKRYDKTGKQKSSLLVAGGTPGYIAPEQMGGVIKEFTPSADIYALGGIFYFLLTGENPSSFIEIMQDKEKFLAKLPEETRPFFEKAMSMSVKERFACVEDFCNSLDLLTAPEDSMEEYPETSDECEENDAKWDGSVEENEESVVASLMTIHEKKPDTNGGYEDSDIAEKTGKGNLLKFMAVVVIFFVLAIIGYLITNYLSPSDSQSSSSGNEIENIESERSNGDGALIGKSISDQLLDRVFEYSEGLASVELNGKWNYIDEDGKTISDQWFDEAYDFHDGFGLIKLNDKYNYIDSTGKILSSQWFDNAWRFDENLGAVQLNKKFNYINNSGELISSQWFDNVYRFDDGLGSVILNGKYNYINNSGKLISDKWLDELVPFYDGFALARLGGKCNYIDKKGKYLSDQWFDDAYSFNEGLAAVMIDGKCNHINKSGKYLSAQWFDGASSFKEGYAIIVLDGKYNYIDKDGKIFSDKFYDNAYSFSEGFGIVEIDNKWNYIDKNGKYLSNQWFDNADPFEEGYAVIDLDEKSNYIDKTGKILSDRWFDMAYDFCNDFGRVELNNKHNYIDKTGKILSNKWFEDTNDFNDGFGSVKLNGKWNYIDKNGKYFSEQWFDEVKDFSDDYATVKLNGKWNFMSKNGNYLSDQWFDEAESFFDGFSIVKLDGKENFINKQGKLKSSSWVISIHRSREE